MFFLVCRKEGITSHPDPCCFLGVRAPRPHFIEQMGHRGGWDWSGEWQRAQTLETPQSFSGVAMGHRISSKDFLCKPILWTCINQPVSQHGSQDSKRGSRLLDHHACSSKTPPSSCRRQAQWPILMWWCVGDYRENGWMFQAWALPNPPWTSLLMLD